MTTYKIPKAVLFDLDGTLYNYEYCHDKAMKSIEEAVWHKLNIDQKAFIDLYEQSKKIVKSRLKGTASSHNRLLYFQTMLELLGLKSQISIALELDHLYWAIFLKNCTLYPEVMELLDTLRIQGIKTALVTNQTAQIQFRKLIWLGIDQYFEAVITSEEVGEEKPAAPMFHLALEKLGLDKEDYVWFIGDEIEGDIEGAKASLTGHTFLVEANIQTTNIGLFSSLVGFLRAENLRES